MPRPQEPVTCGHIDRPRHGSLCVSCYSKARRQALKARYEWERRELEAARIARRLDEIARMPD